MSWPTKLDIAIGALQVFASTWLRSEQLAEVTEMRATFWMLADSWGPELRYLAASPDARDALGLYQAIIKVYCWIAERTV